MEAMAIEGLRQICCQSDSRDGMVMNMDAFLDHARNLTNVVAYQRAQVAPREMEFFKQKRQILFKQWRYLGSAAPLRDDSGKFLTRSSLDSNKKDLEDHNSIPSQKRKRENPYACVQLA